MLHAVNGETADQTPQYSETFMIIEVINVGPGIGSNSTTKDNPYSRDGDNGADYAVFPVECIVCPPSTTIEELSAKKYTKRFDVYDLFAPKPKNDQIWAIGQGGYGFQLPVTK